MHHNVLGETAVVPLSSLSVFFPAYNDAPAIAKLVEEAFVFGSRCTADLEVIVIDDGSSDDTAASVERLAPRYGPRLRLIRHPENRGYGGALRTGFLEATKEFVFYTDGDGQYDVSQLPDLAACVNPEVGLVNGYKTTRSDPWPRVVAGKLYLLAVRLLFRLKVRDVDCDFRLIRRSVLEGVELSSSSGAICVELVRSIQESGCEIREVAVRHLPRRHGVSQFFRFKHIWRTMVDLSELFRKLAVRRRPQRFRFPEIGPASGSQ